MSQPSDADVEALRALVPREFLQRVYRIVQERGWGFAKLELHFQGGKPTTNKVGDEVTFKPTA